METLCIENLLDFMAKAEASDCYISAGAPVAVRINGEVKFLRTKVLDMLETEALVRQLLTDQQLAEFEQKLELNVGLYFKLFGRFRVNVLKQKGSVSMVIRRVKHLIPSFEELNLPPKLKELALLKEGLILVVGPTGSGKSTTLAAMIDYRNQNLPGHIITIEDPIEYYHEHKKCIVTQREVGTDTADFMTALKNALRQAPDVILIGEIRDLPSLEATLHAAQTGHLCLATFHSSNACQTLERLLSFFDSSKHKQILMDLSSCLRAIVAQKLIISKNSSRVPVVEIMLDSPRVKDLILKGKFEEIHETLEKSSNYGMQTFDQHLYGWLSKDVITLEEALKHAESQNNLRLKIKLEGGLPSSDKTKPLRLN